MHIALISTSYPDQTPGSEAAGSFVADFAEELSKYVTVSVLAPGRFHDTEFRGNPAIHRFMVPKLPLSLLSPVRPTHWGAILKTLFAGQRAVNRLVNTGEIDHVFALWALPSGYWARNACKPHGIPYSVWALGSDIWTLGRFRILRAYLKTVLRECRNLFADGYVLKKDVEFISGRACELLPSVRRLPISGKKRIKTGPPYRLAYLGRWHPNKGIDILLKSLKILGDKDWKKIREVLICGGGPLEEQVKAGCYALKSSGRQVSLHGYLNKAEAARLLLRSDYLLLPSRIESIPVVFSDAMQAGCPVITTPVGDLPRILTEYQVGILSADISPRAFAAALRSALRKPPDSYRKGIGSALADFSVEQSARRLLGFLGA